MPTDSSLSALDSSFLTEKDWVVVCSWFATHADAKLLASVNKTCFAGITDRAHGLQATSGKIRYLTDGRVKDLGPGSIIFTGPSHSTRGTSWLLQCCEFSQKRYYESLEIVTYISLNILYGCCWKGTDLVHRIDILESNIKSSFCD
jgi:hypothetical protein